MSKEPALILVGIAAALNSVQVAAISMPLWLHVLIIAASTGLAAVLTRANVTPVP